MKAPTETDRVVRVRAYITDEHFGYDHWQARQFCAPQSARHAVLVTFASEQEQRDFEAECVARFGHPKEAHGD